MKLIKYIIFLFPITILSQTITYIESTKGTVEVQERNLIVNDTISYWERNTNDEELVLKLLYIKKIYKDSLELKYKDGILGTSFNIEDKVQMQWTLDKQGIKDSILGFPCQIAKTEFRGKNYIAYFTTEIPISDGPWKFFGLPGLILKIYSTDEKVRFEAKKVDFQNKNTNYEKQYSKFQKEKFITFNNYKSIFMSKMEDYMKDLSSKEKQNDSDADSKSDFVYDKKDIIFEGKF